MNSRKQKNITTPAPLEEASAPLMLERDEANVLTEGRAAWGRIQRGHHWEDWVAVGKAMDVGQAKVMQASRTDSVDNPTYKAAFKEWLHENGFAEMHKSTKSNLLTCMKNILAIEEWRRELPSQERAPQPSSCGAASLAGRT